MKTLYTVFLLILLAILVPPKLFAISFTKLSNNPVIIPTESWESQTIAMPSVIHKDGKFLMWYSGKGNNGRWQIGIAESTDAINWTKNPNNPIFSRLAIDNKDIHDETVIFDNATNQYIMWYVGSENGASTNYNTYRAVSSDGINWVTSPNTPVYSISTWSNAAISAPFVIKESNSYKMWYITAGRGKWEMGLASSIDGINWIDNVTNPVLISDSNWEGPQIGGPFIRKINNQYEVYYGTNNGINNSPTNISYATSNDGIIWNKNPSENPIITPNIFPSYDSNFIGEANVINVNNINYLFYSSYGNVNTANVFSVSLATDFPIPPSPTVTPTPFPTPTEVPTPTPSPTMIPTPTPTPIHQQTTKVIFIPGFGGSWNLNAILSCNLNTNQTSWESWIASSYVYDNIQKALEQHGYEVLPFYYDWRKLPLETAIDLKNFILANTSVLEKVHIVGHSMGGLIARAYLELEHSNNKIEKLLTVGTPHKGAVQAYPAWSAGEIWGPFYYQAAAALAKFYCYEPGLSSAQLLRKAVPSTQALLPIFDFLRSATNNQMKPISSMIEKNPWLFGNHLYEQPFYGVTVGAISGNGFKTPSMFTYIPHVPLNKKKESYLDGRPIKQLFSIQGDGTILTDSSTVDGAWNTTLQKDHTEIIRSSQAIEQILNFLTGNTSLSRLNILSAANEHLILVANDGDNIEVISPKQKTYKKKKGILAVTEVEDGSYTIRSQGKIGRILIIQKLSETNFSFKEYSASETAKSKRILKFRKNGINLEPLQ